MSDLRLRSLITLLIPQRRNNSEKTIKKEKENRTIIIGK